MKNILILLLTALLFQTGEAAAQSIRLRLPDSTVQVGSRILLPVYVDSTFTGRNVISYQVQLTYESTHLLADSLVITGTLSAGANPIANFNSSGLVTVAAATSSPLTGTGVLFYVRFRVISTYGGYSTNVNFSSATNTYLNQGSPALTFRNGSIVIPALPSINVNPAQATMVVGDSLQFSANGGRVPYSWRLSDTTRGNINSLTANTSRFVATSAGRTRIVATDSNGFSGQTSQEIVVHNFRMFMRDSSQFQGQQMVLPVYVSSLTPWNVVSGSFEVTLSNYPGLQVVGVERAGTLLAAVNQTFIAQTNNTTFQISFANASPITGSGILCYLRIAVPNLYSSNYGFTVNLQNTFFNQGLTALTSSSSQLAIALPLINLTPNTAELVAGETRQFTASNGFAPYRWSVSDTTLASINSSGLLSARRGGVVTVTATDSVNATKTTGAIQLYDTRIHVRDTVLIVGDTLVDVAVYMGQLPPGKSITAIAMAFNFDASRLEPLGVLQTGTSTAGWTVATNRMSTNRYSVALAGTTPQSAAGNLFYLRFRVLPAFVVNNSLSLSTINLTLNEGDPNFLLTTGSIQSLPCTPVANVNPAGNVTFCANQPVQLSGSSGTAYQYQWSRNGVVVAGATNRLFTPVLSGNYTLRVSLNSSCFVVSDTVRVTINPSPIAQILPYADTLHACAGDTVQLRAYREAGYTLQWFRNGSTISGATDTLLKAVLSGAYTVRSTLNGCITTSAAQIVNIRTLPAKPTILVTGSPTCSGDSATLRIPATNLQLQWFNASGPISGATDTLVRVPAGRYTLRLTNTFGCRVYADSVSVVAATASAQIDPSGPTTFCQGGNVNLDLTQATTYVRWFRNGIQLVDTIRPLPVSVSGSYTAAYRLVGNACIFTTPAVVITVTPRPVVTLDSLLPVCANTAAFSLTGGLPAGGTYVGPGVVANQFRPANLAPGTYTIKYGIQQNGCSDTASRTITVLALPGTTFSAPAAVCLNAAAFPLSGGLPAGGTYFGLGVVAGSFNPALAGVGIKSIGYTTQNAAGCRDTVLRNITVNALPAAIINQGPTAAYCQGGNIILNANTGLGLGYQWLRNGLVLSGQTNATLTVNQAGNYRVVVTNASSCSDSSTVTVVTENPLPVSTVTPAGPLTFCQGGAVVLNGINQPNQNYRWLFNGSPVIGNLTSSLTATSSGNYRLIVTNTITACFDTSSVVSVLVNPRPSSVVQTSGPTTLCAGDSVTLTVTSGLSYQWLLNGSPIVGSVQNTLRVGASGNYRVMVTNPITSCFDTSAIVTVQVNPLPVSTVTPAGPLTFCQGGSVVLNGVNQINQSYRWLRNGIPVSGNLSPSLIASISGAYRLIVTNTLTGCFDSSGIVNVLVNPGPTAVITPAGATNICQGDSVTLNANGGSGLDYQWLLNGSILSGSTQISLRVGASGNYRVIVTNTTSGCFDTSATMTVTVNLVPVATITPGGPTTICAGQSVQLVATAGAALSYQWLRNGSVISGQSNALLNATLAGDYRVVVSSAAGCSDSSAAVTVTLNPQPDPAVLTIIVDTIFASPGTDLIWFRNGVLLAGVTDSVLIISQDGNYNALRLSAAGCASDSSNTVVVTNVSVETSRLLPVRIYPNPTQGGLYLELEERSNAALEVEMRSLTGQLVYQQSWPEGSNADRIELDLLDLPQAVYLFRLRQGDRYRHERVVIQR